MQWSARAPVVGVGLQHEGPHGADRQAGEGPQVVELLGALAVGRVASRRGRGPGAGRDWPSPAAAPQRSARRRPGSCRRASVADGRIEGGGGAANSAGRRGRAAASAARRRAASFDAGAQAQAPRAARAVARTGAAPSVEQASELSVVRSSARAVALHGATARIWPQPGQKMNKLRTR